jgi:hypothetical protein
LGIWYITVYRKVTSVHQHSFSSSQIHEKTTLKSSPVIRKDHVISSCQWNMDRNSVYHLQTKAFERHYATIMFSLPFSCKCADLILRCGNTRGKQPGPLGQLVTKIHCQSLSDLPIKCAKDTNFYCVKPFRFQVLSIASVSRNFISQIHSWYFCCSFVLSVYPVICTFSYTLLLWSKWRRTDGVAQATNLKPWVQTIVLPKTVCTGINERCVHSHFVKP